MSGTSENITSKTSPWIGASFLDSLCVVVATIVKGKKNYVCLSDFSWVVEFRVRERNESDCDFE
jgi:hypothetical protein